MRSALWGVLIWLLPAPAIAVPPNPLQEINSVGGVAAELIRALKASPPGTAARVKIEVDRLEIDGTLIQDLEIDVRYRRIEQTPRQYDDESDN